MLDTIDLRAATEADLSLCADFWIAMFEEVGILREPEFVPGWRERFVSYFARRIADDEVQYTLACDGGEIVGTAGAMIADGYPAAIHGLRFGYIFGVRVAPLHRGKGIATALTRDAISFLQRKQCRRIRLHASPFGKPIYQRIGFVPTNEMELSAVLTVV